MSSKQFPIMNRVTEVLHRMDDNSSQPDAMKTCFGILAIMSREDVNKLLIARDGMETILNVMTQHVDKTDIQESGCDLIWSLAFNNTAVKDTIAKHGGASVLVRALKRHSKNADFLKSACGALSNMCQSRLNQEGIASQGGLQPLVGSIHIHQNNAKLLPFIFDALASLIVSNEENARTVSSLGIIPLVVSALARHKVGMEVVKSGCHALAILSDVKGQASKIAFAGGVAIILSLLDTHPSYADLHRVAAVVILRMLQESTHVGREITCNEGVRIFLKSLDKGGAQQDTVAAVTHILFTVTNPTNPSSSNIESQLWLTSKEEEEGNKKIGKASGSGKESGKEKDKDSKDKKDEAIKMKSDMASPTTALSGLVAILGQYSDRRDVVRAACRLLNNLGGFPGVIAALEKLNVLDRVLICVNNHGETRDVVDSTAAMLKAIHRRAIPQISIVPPCMLGLLQLVNNKINDEDVVIAGTETVCKFLEVNAKLLPALQDFDPNRQPDTGVNKTWEKEVLLLYVKILDRISGGSEERISPVQSIAGATPNRDSPSIIKMTTTRKANYTKNAPRVLASVMFIIELYFSSKFIDYDSEICQSLMRAMNSVLANMPGRTSDIGRRIEKVVMMGSQKQGGDVSMREDSEIDADDESNASKKSKSSLTVSRRGRDAKAGAESSKKQTSSEAGCVYPTYISSSGYAIPKVWRTEGEEVPGLESRLLPLHPTNYFSSLPGVQEHEVPRLLDTWPSYLERLIISHSQSSAGFGGMGAQSMSAGERMHVVYEAGSAAGKGLMSRCATPVPYNVPVNGCGKPFEHSLTFDSEFESGNLLRTVQRGDANYDLFLRSDLHTGGHTQWFYFAVSNTHPAALVRLAEQGVQVPPVRVRFNIVNLTKPDSLYNLGMRPVVYSCLEAATKNVGWVRGGSDISYYSNPYGRPNQQGEGVACYYTLSFTLEFHHAKDTVLVAYSYPYTNGDYRSHINKILVRPGSADILRSQRLCQTLSGEECDLLVITDFKGKDRDRIGPINLAGAESYRSDEVQRRVGGTMGRPGAQGGKAGTQAETAKVILKPCFFLSCRVHPGETPASWMMKGVLDFLTSDCTQARLLRQVYVIFIVPMLNPDGVIFGNNRCSLAGVDLNRQWKIPMKGLHPTIYTLKCLMQAQRRLREVVMYIDLHGHSRKYNVFMYGCDEKKKPKPQVRAFPRFFSMHHVGRKYVCFQDCSFHVRKGRESTARVVVAREMNIPCSFTLEATFCGSNYGPLKHCHMHVGHLQETGAALCDAILNFSISEGKVADAMQVPANVRAAAQIEHAIGEEDGIQYSNTAHSIMSDNSGTFSSANITSQIPTGFNITPGASHTFSVVNAASATSTKTNSSSNTSAGGTSSSGHAELRFPSGRTGEAEAAIDQRAAGMGVSVESNSNSRRNSASNIDADYIRDIRDRNTNATANAADIDSDSDAVDGGGDSDLDSLVGTNSTRADIIGSQGGSEKETGHSRTGSNNNLQTGYQIGSGGSGYAELRHTHNGGGSSGDLSSQSQERDRDGKRRIGAGNSVLSSTMPTLGGNAKLSLGMPMSATLSLESNEALQPQPPRDGTANSSSHRGFAGSVSPVAGFGSSSVSASLQGGGTKSNATGDAKRTAKDDSALTRSGYRVMDGMTTLGSSSALQSSQGVSASNQMMVTSSKDKGSGSSKKKKGTLKTTMSAKSQRSRSKDGTGAVSKESFDSDTDVDKDALPRL